MQHTAECIYYKKIQKESYFITKFNQMIISMLQACSGTFTLPKNLN